MAIYGVEMKKKDAYIFFNHPLPTCKITQLIVTDINQEYYADRFQSSHGKCFVYWKDTGLLAFWMMLTIDFGFETGEWAWKAFDELRKIDEWKSTLKKAEDQMRMYWI